MRIGGDRRVLGLFLGIGLIAGAASLSAQEGAYDGASDDPMPILPAPGDDADPSNGQTTDDAVPNLLVQDPGDDDAMPKSTAKSKSKAKSKTKARRPGSKKNLGKNASKKEADAEDMPAAAESDDSAPAPADDGAIKFSRDIAPILVGNCISCHNPKDKAKRKEFDLTTFANLMKGGADGPPIVPGKPEESILLLRVKGEETPKMPPGQNNLGPEAIAKIEAWVKAGALLDQGIEPTAELAKVAPDAESLRRDALAKMSPEQLDAKAKDVALARWAKASSKTTPEMTSERHFLVFGTLPADRAKGVLKALEAQYQTVGRMLGPLAAKTALGSPEKISVYVFNDANAYVEFVRALENRELEPGVESHANFAVESPYIVAVDPLRGGAETVTKTAAKKSSRAKRAAADDAPSGPGRSLAGLACESLGAGVMSGAGQPPRWLVLGTGAYLGSKVEPRSPYYRQLRSEAYATFDQGTTKVREAIGGEGENERIKAVGFSLIECLASTSPAAFPPFVRAMAAGGEKFDDAANGIFNATPEQFLEYWASFVATRYRRGR